MEVQDQKWRDERNDVMDCKKATFALSGKCQLCNKILAILKCKECCKDICQQCDQTIHPDLPLHNRSSFTQGFLEPLPPTECVGDDGVAFSTGIA